MRPASHSEFETPDLNQLNLKPKHLKLTQTTVLLILDLNKKSLNRFRLQIYHVILQNEGKIFKNVENV